MNTIQHPTWRELAAIINAMGLADQLKPMSVHVGASTFISVKVQPEVQISSRGIDLIVRTVEGMIIPNSDDIAIYACEVAGIDLVQSQDLHTYGRWDWVSRARGEASGTSLETQSEAAYAALTMRYRKQDWQQDVINGDTECGYVQWALACALADSCEAVEIDMVEIAVANG